MQFVESQLVGCCILIKYRKHKNFLSSIFYSQHTVLLLWWDTKIKNSSTSELHLLNTVCSSITCGLHAGGHVRRAALKYNVDLGLKLGLTWPKLDITLPCNCESFETSVFVFMDNRCYDIKTSRFLILWYWWSIFHLRIRNVNIVKNWSIVLLKRLLG